VVDRKLKLAEPPVAATSNPARAVTSFGGVARNVAETLARLGTPVELVSRVGDDDSGRALIAHLAAIGVHTSGVRVALSGETAQYVAVLDPEGGLVLGAAAMDVLDGLAPSDLDAGWPGVGVGSDTWVFADCNLPIDTLAHAVRRAREAGTRLAVDAVSTPKVVRLPRDLTGVEVLFCNLDEAQALAVHHGWPTTGNTLDLVQLLHDHGAAHVVLGRAEEGVVIGDGDGTRLLPATAASVYDVTGAGDALIAGTLTLLATGVDLDDAVLAGTLVAALTVESQYSVRPDLSADLVDSAALHRLRRPGLIAASRARAEDAARSREVR
jgi:pseudouridine kinase